MKRAIAGLTVGLVAGLVLGLLVYPELADPSPGGPAGSARGPARLTTRGSDVIDAWPVSRSWAWTVNPVATKRRVGVCVRTVETEVPAGRSPAVPGRDRPPPRGTGTERHSGWHLVGGQRMKVMCQLVDLGEIGLAEAAGKRPLRLLVRLTVAGGTAPIRGAESVLEGETLAHTAEVEPAWAGDEMHLLTVETRTGNRLYSHYVLLQQEDAN